MQSNSTEGYGARASHAWLLLRVHADAFVAAPKAYLTACWWRLKRKRVRSRSQFATLLGASPRAYSLWALRQERATRSGAGEGAAGDVAASLIVVLTDIGAGSQGIDAMLRSLLNEGIEALIVESQGLGEAAAHIH